MRKIEIQESELLKKAGLGTFAKKIEQIIFVWKNYKIISTLFATDAEVKKYWSTEIFKNDISIYQSTSFEAKKDLQTLKQQLFDFVKTELRMKGA